MVTNCYRYPPTENKPSSNSQKKSPKVLGFPSHLDIEGKVREGRDGQKWQNIRQGKQFIWHPVRFCSEFQTEYNGRSMFGVRITNLNTAYVYDIYAHRNDRTGELDDDCEPLASDIAQDTMTANGMRDSSGDTYSCIVRNPFPIRHFSKMFLPEDRASVLFQMDNHRYIVVDLGIGEFHSDDEIREYHSLFGPSAVPYPFAVSDTMTYFIMDDLTTNCTQKDTL